MNTTNYKNKQEILHVTTEYIRKTFQADSSGHDWWHIYRVVQLAKAIQKREGGNLFIIHMAALLHDLDDHKFKTESDDSEATLTIQWLSQLNIDKNINDHIISIVKNVSFRGSSELNKIATLEGQIVQDADRLDAIGAIGIARAFAFGGYKGTSIYDPTEKPDRTGSYEKFKLHKSSSINHFYEKLLLLKDRMNTESGQQIAESRHAFMKMFLEHFYVEWDGNDLENT